MRLGYWTYPALISALLICQQQASAARRPTYGGVLRVETRARVFDLAPSAEGGDARNAFVASKLVRLIAEPLVELDGEARLKPRLAASWTSSPDFRHWTFQLRPGVLFHDGSPVTPDAVLRAVSPRMESYRFAAGADKIVIEADEPAPRLPAELAAPGNEVWRRSEEGAVIGTGPFRLEELDPGHSAAFLAFEKHWEGRPFLDGIVVQMGRDLREQQIALELGKADIVEVPLEEVKRAIQRGGRVAMTKPLELMALVLSPGSGSRLTSRLGAALAVAIDRGAIHRVLFQRQGEEAWALVPGWMSGYAFLFAEKRDTGRARALAAEAGVLSDSLNCAADPEDALAKAVVERIALDAQSAGIRIRTAAAPAAQPDLRLARLPIRSADVGQALTDMAGRLRLTGPDAIRLESPQRQFETERDLLRDRIVLPLFHLPLAYGLSKRLRAKDTEAMFEPGAWRLDTVWIEGTAPEAGETR